MVSIDQGVTVGHKVIKQVGNSCKREVNTINVNSLVHLQSPN